MKEKLYTIPLMDAFRAGEECPFCYVERSLEEHAIDFVLGPGASYMEDDVRAETDAMGFCRTHFKKRYEYGNRLGTGLILKTHFQKLNQELDEQIKMFAPSHASLMSRLKKNKTLRVPQLVHGRLPQRKNAISVILTKIRISAIWIPSLNYTEKIRNLKSCLKTVKAFAYHISENWQRKGTGFFLIRRRKNFTASFFL